MTEDSKQTKNIPQGSKIYTVGDVGSGAQVAIGEHIQQMKQALASLPDSDVLEQQFATLMKHIAQAPDIDAETRELALEKTRAVAEGVAHAKESPRRLVVALREARDFLSSSVKGVWEGLCKILQSEAAQKTISAIVEGSTKAAITALIGVA